jgi:hypothetical protein
LIEDMPELVEWNNFYVIVGSASGALIGLQFVAMTLIAQRPRLGNPEAGDAFATPGVVHFCVVLLLSAIATAPWHAISAAEVFWGLIGLIGIVYTVIVIRRMRRQNSYQPVFEDWLFHALLPFAAYASLAASAYVAYLHSHAALFVIGAAALLLLFVGIHNAWDAVTYHVLFLRREQSETEHHR